MVGSRHFRVEVLTPESTVFEGQASAARVPASDGLMGILGGRAPMVAHLGAGEMTFDIDGQTRAFFLAGGFGQMREDRLTVLADQCIPVEKLSPEKAWDELSEARKLPHQTDTQEAYRERAVETARIKFRIAQKYHGRRRPDTADTKDEWD